MKKVVLNFILVLFSVLGFSQNVSDLNKENSIIVPVLVFENLGKRELKFVRETGTLQYALRSNPKKKITGVLEKVKNKSMIINGQEIQFADCEYIKGKVRTDKDLIGGMLVGAGVSSLAFGGVFIGTVQGLTIVAVGAAALGTGISLVSSKKKFNFNKGWEVYGGEIEYKR
jgi:uncharacterized protein YkvS